ncbi:unnamed protein product [Sphagnum balticum]
MLGAVRTGSLERRGEIYAKKNQTEDAINDFSAAIALSRKKNYATATWMTRNELAQEYLTRSGLYERDGNWTEVLADAKSALDLNPSISSAHGVEAKALDALRKPVEAKRELSLQKVMNRFDSNTKRIIVRLGIVSAVSEHSFQINQNITLEPSIDSSRVPLYASVDGAGAYNGTLIFYCIALVASSAGCPDSIDTNFALVPLVKSSFFKSIKAQRQIVIRTIIENLVAQVFYDDPLSIVMMNDTVNGIAIAPIGISTALSTCSLRFTAPLAVGTGWEK